MGAQPPEKKSTGAIISIIVIVLVLAFGAYYFLKQVPATQGPTGSTSGEATQQADALTATLSTQGTSTDIADIKKDMDATNLSGIDAGLSNLTI